MDGSKTENSQQNVQTLLTLAANSAIRNHDLAYHCSELPESIMYLLLNSSLLENASLDAFQQLIKVWPFQKLEIWDNDCLTFQEQHATSLAVLARNNVIGKLQFIDVSRCKIGKVYVISCKCRFGNDYITGLSATNFVVFFAGGGGRKVGNRSLF